MSVRVLSRVFDESRAKLASRLVLLAIADEAYDDGVAFAGQARLAAKALVNIATVRRAVRELESAGELETRYGQAGRTRVNVYRVLLPGLIDPDYKRLGIKLSEPFTAAQDARPSYDPSEPHDRANQGATTAQIQASTRARDPLGTRKAPVEGANAPSLDDAPKLTLVDGQNLPYNALRDSLQIDAKDRQAAKEIGWALNGAKTKGLEVGIRQLAWEELVEGKFGGDPAAAGEVVTGQPDRFEAYVASLIGRRVLKYRAAMAGAILTPLALAKWWLRLEGLAQTDGLSPDDVRNWGAQ